MNTDKLTQPAGVPVPTATRAQPAASAQAQIRRDGGYLQIQIPAFPAGRGPRAWLAGARVILTLSPVSFKLCRHLAGVPWGRERPLAEITCVAIEPANWDDAEGSQLVLRAGSRRYAFGRGLARAEQEALATEIRNHLRYAGLHEAAARSQAL